MKSGKIAFVHITVLLLTFVIVRTGLSQGKGTGGVSFTGVIESISEDLKSIIINETKISISRSTQIFDESGNAMKPEGLKPQLYIGVEAVKKRDGLSARRILVKKLKGI